MTYDQILTLIVSLASGDPNTAAFEQIISGGYDPATPVAVAPCPRPLGREEIERETIICGTVSVPETHSASEGRRIDLAFTVLKSHSTYPAPDPLVHLHGGPGAGILGGIEFFAETFDPWRQTRDIVMFDQRAAGLSSTSVDCYEALTANVVDIVLQKASALQQTEDGVVASQAMTECIKEIKDAGVQLQHYNTYENALDVPAVVKALGYETYNLYGISYGTKLSLEVMRAAPEGLRSVILDGVAPASIHLYNTLGVPVDQAIGYFIDECAADEACSTAYPNLDQVLREVLAKAAKGELVFDGEPLPMEAVLALIMKRNGIYKFPSFTGHLPAAIYELHRGEGAPTFAMLFEKNFALDPPGPDDVRKAADDLSDEQKRLVDIALTDAGILKEGNVGLDLTVDELKELLRRDRALGPLPALLDQEMSKYVRLTVSDPDRARSMLVDYAGLQNAEPSKATLADFIGRNFEDEGGARLGALVEAMTDAEVKAAFDAIRAEIARHEKNFTGDLHLWIYACQEDVPYNSPEGFAAQTAKLDWPEVAAIWKPEATRFFESCKLFDQHPRPEFNEPVVSDIPTLSIGSTWDTQTAPRWAEVAVESLTNAQSFIIPEAGHGALAYQPCVKDMGVAFINDPTQKLDSSCPESIKPTYYIAPWAEEHK